VSAVVDAALDLVAHLCTATALGFATRTSRISRGWLRVAPAPPPERARSLSIVVPARDEERNIERCVRSLLAQRLDDLEVIVVDDRSSDRTPEILASLTHEDERLRVVHGAALPPDWVGKPWACAQGAQIARGDWLLFTDADSWHAPEASGSVLAFAAAHGADAVTLGTFQELGTLAERAILPAILGLILIAAGPASALNDPHDAEHALANGQYFMISRDAYETLGGHAALRNEIVEDLAFARRLKHDGRFRLILAGGEALVRVRMYRSFREIWDGFTKNMYLGAQGDLGALGSAAFALALLSVVPAALVVEGTLRCRLLRTTEAAFCLALVVAVQRFGLRHAGLDRRLAVFSPIGLAVCAAIVVNSTLRVLSGRGVEWRGRRYSGRMHSLADVSRASRSATSGGANPRDV